MSWWDLASAAVSGIGSVVAAQQNKPARDRPEQFWSNFAYNKAVQQDNIRRADYQFRVQRGFTERQMQEAKMERDRQYYIWAKNRSDQLNKFRLQVADAKRAGLHPLFAMGTSANYSPSTYMPVSSGVGSPGGSHAGAVSLPNPQILPGQHGSGSWMQAGVEAAASMIGEVLRNNDPVRKREKAIAELRELKEINALDARADAYRAQANRDDIESMSFNSRNKTATARESVAPTGSSLPSGSKRSPVGVYRPEDLPYDPAEDIETDLGGIVGEATGVLNALDVYAKHQMNYWKGVYQSAVKAFKKR